MLHGLNRFGPESRLLSWPYYPGGIVGGLALETDGRMALITHEVIQPTSVLGLDAYSTQLYRDGAFFSRADPNESLPIIMAGNREIVDGVLTPRAADEHSGWRGTTMFAGRAAGDQVRLWWADAPDDTDFYSYVIYWDAGEGGDVDQILVEVRARHEREYVTMALGSGTFIFRLAYRDVLGNEESDPAKDVTVTTLAPPAQPSIESESYNQTTRKQSITFDTTDPIWIWTNYIPGVGQEGKYVHFQTPFRIKRSGATWISPELWEGKWRYWFTRRNKYGLNSIPATLEYRLVKSGGALIRVEEFGNAVNPLATAKAGALIDLSWDFEGAAPNETRVEIWVNLVPELEYVLWATVMTTASPWQFAGVDGKVYRFKFRSRYAQGGVVEYGDWTAQTEAVADASGPDGDHVLEAEVFG